MPRKPLSHSQRQGRATSDRQYETQGRALTPALALAKKLRGSARWKHVRRLVLGKQPLCADPFGRHATEGRAVLAEEVDHIVGLAERPDLCFTESNLQGLCIACHRLKEARARKD